MNLRNRTREEDSKPCVTSVTISFVETTLRQISLVYVHNAMAVIFDFITDADWRE